MKRSGDFDIRGVMDGSDRSVAAAVLRIVTSSAAPVYTAAVRARNALYDCRLLADHPLPRPAISVGNITAGGTGKTPMVCWLAQRLAAAGQRPAILLRGYKSTRQGLSDEQAALAEALRESPAGPLAVVADPDRRRSAAEALRTSPQTSLFILDDAMQHRQVRRDFELVLIHAREPFGLGRSLPRGLLREPLAGLRRADAFVITHADEADQAQLAEITALLRRRNPAAPIFHADHVIDAFRSVDGQAHPPQILAGKRYFAFCGIGSPASFFSRLRQISDSCADSKAFADHYHYGASDWSEILRSAQAAQAEMILTTEKDWVKLSALAGASTSTPPSFIAQLSLRFWPDEEERLLAAILQAAAKTRPLDSGGV